MSEPRYTYHVERERRTGDWSPVPFTQNPLTWCRGYVAAFQDLYPSPRVRLVRSDGRVLDETGGNCVPSVQARSGS